MIYCHTHKLTKPMRQLIPGLMMALLGWVPAGLLASDLIELIPLTPKVIALHFDDGTVHYHGYHQEGNEDVVVSDPLDLDRAVHLQAYRLFSLDDPEFFNGVRPVRTGRKSKPTAISDSCRWTGEICDNEYVSEHWIYLELPHELKRGYTYTLWMGELAANLDEITFEFNEFEQFSELIHVNQQGYTPSSPVKFAYLAHWAGDFGAIDLDFLEGNTYYLMDAAGGSLEFQGTIATRRRGLEEEDQDFGSPESWGSTNNVYGSDVWEVDFSAFTTPGEYRLVVEGVGCSFPFRLDENVYREAYYKTIRGLYYQRAGISKEPEYAGKWARPRDHHPADGIMELYHSTWPSVLSGEGSSSKEDILDHVEGKITGWGWGWYHDAGDWDGYVHHTDVPYFLLASYELAPQNFADNELMIPESGNGIPDLLDEAGWLINYFRRNQRPDGSVPGGRVNSDFNEKPDASPSYEDSRPWYVCGADPQTAYLFAGLATQYAYCLELAGITDSTPALLAEAEAAYQWAGENHELGGEIKVKGATIPDLRMYAAANLYKLTGQDAFQQEIIRLNRVDSEAAGLSGGDYNQTKAVWSYITSPWHPNMDPDLRDRLVAATINYARSEFLDPATKRSARMGYSWNKPAVVGSTTTPITIAPMFAQHVSEGAVKQEFLDYMYTTADFFLGNNPLNMSWITGMGDRYPRRMLHLDSRYDQAGVDENVPGLVPYGPLRNGDHFMGDNGQGPWDADFAKIRSYPDRYQWPVSEFWFDSPYSVLDGEFTVHQTNAPAASSYGFLSADTTIPFSPNQPAEITILSPSSPQTIDESDSLIVEVAVSDDRRVGRVYYFLDNHPVEIYSGGSSGICVPVMDLPEGTYTLKAMVKDSDGMETVAKGPLISIDHRYQGTFIFPSGTDALAQGEGLDLEVDVSEISGPTVEQVTLLLNGRVVETDLQAPYEFRIDSLGPLFNQVKAIVLFEEGFSSSISRELKAIPLVAGVELKKKEAEIHAGEYLTLEYELFPPEAPYRQVAFQSTDENVALVNESGRVEAVSEGVARVVITSEEGGYSDTALVTVLPPRPEGPFGGEPVILPGVIEAENFDFGGEGIAYHDLTQGNSEEAYRNEDVDVGQSFDEGANAYHVTAIQTGEWLKYSVYVPETNLYAIRFRYTAGAGEPSITLKQGEKELTTITLPVVGWYPFESHTTEGVLLEEGEQELMLCFENGALTLNYLELLCDDCSTILPNDINLNYHDLEIGCWGKVQLSASLFPPETSNRRVFWKSLDDEVAYVDADGTLTALSVGTASVIAVSDSRGLTDTCRVTVTEEGGFTSGIRFQYFEGSWDQVPEFNIFSPVTSGQLPNFDISPALQEDLFGFRFFGEIAIDSAGTYQFFTTSDDGSLLYLDGKLVVDNDGLHAAVEQGGTMELDTGSHQIEVLFFEKSGGASLQVAYQGPGTDKGLIPDSILGTRVVEGEQVPLQGFILPDTIWVELTGSAVPILLPDPADASDSKIAYSSDDPGVTLVNQYGYLEGISEGSALVSGISRDGGHTGSFIALVVNDTPRIEFLSPADGSLFQDTGGITIDFTILDTIGGVHHYLFYLDQELMEPPSAEPPFILPAVGAGDHLISITATDTHGKAGFSDTVSFTVTTPATAAGQHQQTGALEVRPNPFREQLRLKITPRSDAEALVQIIDMAGRIRYISSPLMIRAGGTLWEWDASLPGGEKLPGGIYLCRILFRDQSMQTPLEVAVVKE